MVGGKSGVGPRRDAPLGGSSAVALVVSSHSTLKPKDAAVRAFLLTLRFSPALILLTLLIIAINFFVAAFHKTVAFGYMELVPSLKVNLWSSVASQLWQGLTSIIVWPFSITLICEML